MRTLSHAVARDQVHHAYLFVGSRGTGKTSMAKILAACLNCVEGPTVSPCGRCEACVAIASATSLDVIEMDAASNNSVDDIRELRETVAYAPVSGRHKVYILDEAHMLSTQAWNAFLKTLEEPPPRTVFVLATTEAQKVLPTVVDRCHRFDFGRPTAAQVATVVRRVAAAEAIKIDDGAVGLIARHATGSFRDALGTLEQLVTYAGDAEIATEDVLAVLGVADGEQLFAAVDAVAARDPAGALRAAAALAATGRDPGQMLRDLEAHARELLTAQVLGEVAPELRLTPEHDQRLLEQAGALAPSDAVRLLDLLADALQASAGGAQPRVQLELALVRAAAPEMDPSMRALLARIEDLERGRPQPIRQDVPPPAAPVTALPDPDPAPVTALPEPDPTPVTALRGASPVTEPERPAPGRDEMTLADMQRLWPAVVDLVKGANAMLGVLLDSASPASLSDRELVLSFPAEAAFYKRKAEQDDYRRSTAEAVRNVTGRTLSLSFELAEGSLPAEPTDLPAPAETLSGDELVARLVADFDAEEIVDHDQEGEH